MSDQLNIFQDGSCQESTPSHSEVLAKISVSPESERALKANAVVLSGTALNAFGNSDLTFLFGKTLKEHSAATVALIFGRLSKPLPTLGAIDLNGNCLIRHGFYPKPEAEFTLLDILQPEVDDRYFLSRKAIKTMRKYDNDPTSGLSSTASIVTIQKGRTEREP